MEVNLNGEHTRVRFETSNLVCTTAQPTPKGARSTLKDSLYRIGDDTVPHPDEELVRSHPTE
jgi:hypothetical protein